MENGADDGDGDPGGSPQRIHKRNDLFRPSTTNPTQSNKYPTNTNQVTNNSKKPDENRVKNEQEPTILDFDDAPPTEVTTNSNQPATEAPTTPENTPNPSDSQYAQTTATMTHQLH